MKWKTLQSDKIFEEGFFSLNRERCELPDGRIMPKYFVFNFMDWVNVFPVTQDDQVIFVEQYRQAGKEVFLELPGGGTHPGEDLAQAAQRELAEETGYAGEEIHKVFSHYPNPALQNNEMHTYMVSNCRKTSSTQFDPFEDLRTVLIPIKEVRARMATLKFSHTIVMASVYRCLDDMGL